jgi:hypothetical protein
MNEHTVFNGKNMNAGVICNATCLHNTRLIDADSCEANTVARHISGIF